MTASLKTESLRGVTEVTTQGDWYVHLDRELIDHFYFWQLLEVLLQQAEKSSASKL